MRSDKLGYNAPIEVYGKKYYRYEDPDFSITNIPITTNDMDVLSETVEMLKQFKDFSLFSELRGIIQRLEDKVYTEQNDQPAIIHLDKNDQLKGLEHLDTLYQAILKNIVLDINYQSFKARKAAVIPLHPYILKSYNNRWFLVGRKDRRTQILTLALDRISGIDYNLKIKYNNKKFDGEKYYRNTIGVTVLPENQIETVVFTVDRHNAPYVLTKPFHHSQEVLERLDNGKVRFSMQVQHNYELERLLLGFGAGLQVEKPRRLKSRIKRILKHAVEMY